LPINDKNILSKKTSKEKVLHVSFSPKNENLGRGMNANTELYIHILGNFDERYFYVFLFLVSAPKK